jgi:hypothetical protein
MSFILLLLLYESKLEKAMDGINDLIKKYDSLSVTVSADKTFINHGLVRLTFTNDFTGPAIPPCK